MVLKNPTKTTDRATGTGQTQTGTASSTAENKEYSDRRRDSQTRMGI